MTSPNTVETNQHHEIIQPIGAQIEIIGRSTINQGDLATTIDVDSGTMGIVQAVEEGKGEQAQIIADGVRDVFHDTFDIDSPKASAFRAATRANQLAGELETPVSMTYSHTYQGILGNQRAVIVSVGEGQAVYDGHEHPTTFITDETGREGVLDGTEAALSKVQVEVIDLDEGDRLMLLSPTAAKEVSEVKLPIDLLAEAEGTADSREAADKLIGNVQGERDKIVTIQDVLTESERRAKAERLAAGDNPTVSGITPVGTPTGASASGEGRRGGWVRNKVDGLKERWANRTWLRRRQNVGHHALAGSGIAAPLTVAALREREGYNQESPAPAGHARRSLWRRANDRAIDGMFMGARRENRSREQDADFYRDNWNHPRYANMTATERAAAIEQNRLNEVRARREDRNLGKGAIVAGVLLVGGLLAYKYGERTILDLGDGLDKGYDGIGWPLDGGADANQGDGSGVDYNSSNRSETYNDDPTIAHWDRSGAQDWAPSWMDGDPMDPWHWTGTDTERTWDAGDSGLSDPRESGAGDGGGNGSGLENIPDEIPVPNPDDHFVEMKEFVGGIEQGGGLINELDQYAHGPMGIPSEGFDALKAEWVHQELIKIHGNDYIDLLNFNGPDTYVQDGDVRISSPDARAQFASWAVQADAERLIREAAERTDLVAA